MDSVPDQQDMRTGIAAIHRDTNFATEPLNMPFDRSLVARDRKFRRAIRPNGHLFEPPTEFRWLGQPDKLLKTECRGKDASSPQPLLRSPAEMPLIVS